MVKERSEEERRWLAPYYRWKNMLWRFGLKKEEVETEPSWISPITFYRYKKPFWKK